MLGAIKFSRAIAEDVEAVAMKVPGMLLNDSVACREVLEDNVQDSPVGVPPGVGCAPQGDEAEPGLGPVGARIVVVDGPTELSLCVGFLMHIPSIHRQRCSCQLWCMLPTKRIGGLIEQDQ